MIAGDGRTLRTIREFDGVTIDTLTVRPDHKSAILELHAPISGIFRLVIHDFTDLAGNQGGLGSKFGLGFRVVTDVGDSQALGSDGMYGWSGIYGTYFWVDPRTNLFVVFMMQSPKQRVPYRSVLRNMVYAAVER
jgi:CubicO group peptidase (beta-lactamase class C family)